MGVFKSPMFTDNQLTKLLNHQVHYIGLVYSILTSATFLQRMFLPFLSAISFCVCLHWSLFKITRVLWNCNLSRYRTT